jgi:hypothetical protein
VLIRLTGTEDELILGLIRVQQSFDELTDVTDPYPSDEQPDLLNIDATAWF